MITDGAVHDIPADAAALGIRRAAARADHRPPDERDRRIALAQTPRFGIVGQAQIVDFRVE